MLLNFLLLPCTPASYPHLIRGLTVPPRQHILCLLLLWALLSLIFLLKNELNLQDSAQDIFSLMLVPIASDEMKSICSMDCAHLDHSLCHLCATLTLF